MKAFYDEILQRFPEVIGPYTEDYVDLPYCIIAEVAVWLINLKPDEITPEIIQRVVDLRDWCESQPGTEDAATDIYTIYVVGFYEKLFDHETTRHLILQLSTKEDLIRNEDYLKSWVGEENYNHAFQIMKPNGSANLASLGG